MKFKRIYIEITNVCNLKCSFCSACLRAPRFMSAEEFEYILQQVKPYCSHIYLHVKGEPLLHPLLESFFQLAHKYRFHINLTTNGTLLANYQDLLLNSPALRQVNISVHSLEQTSAESAAAYLQSLSQFGITAMHSGRPYVSYRMWNGDDSTQITPTAHKQLQAICTPFSHTLPPILPKQRMAAKLASNVFISFAERFEWPSLDLPVVSTYGKCLGGKDMLAILADGTLVPCCLDSDGVIPLGNIFKDTFSEILATSRYLTLREGFSGKNISEELCRRCSYRKRFDK
ncbi:MAG: radical SAM protein [Oscillospiraceae bacterium]|nr:radical SAM protein [Oscillospiraceae bacterium]